MDNLTCPTCKKEHTCLEAFKKCRRNCRDRANRLKKVNAVKKESLDILEKLKKVCHPGEPEKAVKIKNFSNGGSEVVRRHVLTEAAPVVPEPVKKEVKKDLKWYTLNDLEDAVLHTLPMLHDEALAVTRHYLFQAAIKLFLEHDLTSRASEVIQFALKTGIYKKV